MGEPRTTIRKRRTGTGARNRRAAPRGAEIELVVDSRLDSTAARALLPKDGKHDIRFHRFDPALVIDPIAKGRLLAELQASDFVVVVGWEAGGWVARELEGVPV